MGSGDVVAAFIVPYVRRRPAMSNDAGTEPNVRAATQLYEDWLRTQIDVVEDALGHKHEAMRESSFAFLRATYYRWARVWPTECSDVTMAPHVTAIGDLHIENFGTWRDAEGRLAWGVNDFDEAAPLPYTNDLVRLAASAFVARKQDRLSLTEKDLCAAVLDGYRTTLSRNGEPIIFAESHGKLGEHVLGSLLEPRKFWSTKVGEDLSPEPVPAPPCEAVLMAALPAESQDIRIHARTAGLGSLGRPRFVALADWKGGRIAREAKAFVPSAMFAAVSVPRGSKESFARQLLTRAVRSRDPFLALSNAWIVRRLAPDSGKIRLANLGERDLEERLVRLMGSEAANVHLATAGARDAVLEDLRTRGTEWLRVAATRMVAAVEKDYAAWR
jgi:hypothetical protein